jgi:hypothetical protein
MKEYTVKVFPDGRQEWFLNGKCHREDGPAVIDSNGTQEWYLNDNLHREDGPAIIRPDGTQSWYLNDNLHREDGPAVIHPDGFQSWYLNGIKLTEDEFNNRKNSCDGKIVEIDDKKYKLTSIS